MNKHIGTWALVRVDAVDGEGEPIAPPFGGDNFIGRVVLTAEGRLITNVVSCSDPARMGTNQVRNVTFEDDLMVLEPPLRSYSGKPAERRTLWWKKISDI